MATIIFDFDSTLISCESLEIILERKLKQHSELAREIDKITKLGLRGKISFADSLSQRLAIAAPSRKEVEVFGNEAFKWLTDGMEDFVQSLHLSSFDIWVISGGIIESLIPLTQKLKIPDTHVHGVKLLWNEKGDYLKIDESIPFCRSKVEGTKPFLKKWKSPIIGIGDAMSDYNLYEAGAVEFFIAYTEHFCCDEVLEKGVPSAKNVGELKRVIEDLIDVEIISG